MEAFNQAPRIYYPWVKPKGIMNIRNLRTSWIDIDEQYLTHCNLKASLLKSTKATVFQSRSTDLTSSTEVLEHILGSLPKGVASRSGQIVHNHLTGKSFSIDSTHPLEIASLLIQSDLCIMTPINGDYVLTDACVCFPDRWRLSEKIGKGIAGIHVPVKHFKKIRRAVNGFMSKMKQPKYRFNYTFSPTDALYFPEGVEGENRFLRVEKQCFFRLKCGSILFTIRTYLQPIEEMDESVFAPLLEVLDGRELRTSLGNAKGKYVDVRDFCIKKVGQIGSPKL